MNPGSRFSDNDLLLVSTAAEIAGRSVRTIRRAYLSGALIAHRDGNGRSVRIRCGDLRAWMLAQPIAPLSPGKTATVAPAARAGFARPVRPLNSRNLAVLNAARAKRATPAPGRADGVELDAEDRFGRARN